MLPYITFFEVSSSVEKLKKISSLAAVHYERDEPLLIWVKDDLSAKYVDEWLWKYPPCSFIPHTVTNEPANDKILISPLILPHHSHLINLCPSPVSFSQENPLRHIYEFEDPSSKELVKKKFHYYKERGCTIEALSL